MPIDYSSPPDPDAFAEAVWKIVRQIPYGRVAAYGQVAAYIPCPAEVPQAEYEAYRARWAGQAMAKSPPDVPWQRVINAQGKISLKTALQMRQRHLLESEGVTFDARDKVDMQRFAWSGPDSEWLRANGFIAPPDEYRQESWL
jgi:methylated-DNA-protein-cysteine methyltransferase-like protein